MTSLLASIGNLFSAQAPRAEMGGTRSSPINPPAIALQNSQFTDRQEERSLAIAQNLPRITWNRGSLKGEGGVVTFCFTSHKEGKPNSIARRFDSEEAFEHWLKHDSPATVWEVNIEGKVEFFLGSSRFKTGDPFYRKLAARYGSLYCKEDLGNGHTTYSWLRIPQRGLFQWWRGEDLAPVEEPVQWENLPFVAGHLKLEVCGLKHTSQVKSPRPYRALATFALFLLGGTRYLQQAQLSPAETTHHASRLGSLLPPLLGSAIHPSLFWLFLTDFVAAQGPAFNPNFLAQLPNEFDFEVGLPFTLDLTDAASGGALPTSISVAGPPWLQISLGLAPTEIIEIGRSDISDLMVFPQAILAPNQIAATNGTHLLSLDRQGNLIASSNSLAIPLTVGGNVVAVIEASPTIQLQFANLSMSGFPQIEGSLPQMPVAVNPDLSISITPDGRWAHFINASGIYNLIDLTTLSNPQVTSVLSSYSPLVAIGGDLAILQVTAPSTGLQAVTVANRSSAMPTYTNTSSAFSSPDSRVSAQQTRDGTVNAYFLSGLLNFIRFDSNGSPLGSPVTQGLAPGFGQLASSGAALLLADDNSISLFDLSVAVPNAPMVGQPFDFRTLFSGESVQIRRGNFCGNQLFISLFNSVGSTRIFRGAIFDVFSGNLSGVPTVDDAGSGLLTFTANNGFDTAVLTVPYTVRTNGGSGTTGTSDGSGDLVGAVVGATLGGVYCILCAGGAALFLIARRRRHPRGGLDIELAPERSVRRLKPKEGTELIGGRYLQPIIDTKAMGEIAVLGGNVGKEGEFKSGAHGRVVAVVDTQDRPYSSTERPVEGDRPRWRAAKLVEKGVKMSVANAYEASKEEQRIWKKVQGNRVMPLIGIYEDEQLLYSVMPIIECDSKTGLAAAARLKKTNPVAALTLLTGSLRDTLEGLETVHSKGVTHADITPENLFVFRDGRVVIGDFGRAVEQHDITSENGGTWWSYNYERLRTGYGEQKSCNGFVADLYAAALAHVVGWVGYDPNTHTGRSPWTIFQMPPTAKALHSKGPTFIGDQINSLPELNFLREPDEGTVFWVIRGLLLGTLTHGRALKASCFSNFDDRAREEAWNIARRPFTARKKVEQPLPILPDIDPNAPKSHNVGYFDRPDSPTEERPQPEEDLSSEFAHTIEDIPYQNEKREENYRAKISPYNNL
ncbi:MAG: protein kinase [Candidatus Obscuribacterales bacterium]